MYTFWYNGTFGLVVDMYTFWYNKYEPLESSKSGGDVFKNVVQSGTIE
jgi:hypothetical protein